MLLLVAVLMAITAVTVAVAPQRADDEAATTATPASPTPAAAPPRDSPAARDDEQLADAPLATMDARRRRQLVRVVTGQRVRLRVVSRGLETVQVGTDGPIQVVDRDSPAEFDILGEAGLNAQVRLLESDRTIGRLVAQP